MPLFPLLDATDRIVKQPAAAETDLGLLRAILKMACRISHPFHRDLSASQQRNFEGPDPYVPVRTQKTRHIIVYSHIWIYPYTFIGFSNPEGAPLFLLSNLAAFSTRTRHRKIAALLTLGVVNISCDKKGRSQSFLQVKVPPDAFRFPVQALVLKKKATLLHTMKGALLTEMTSHFLLFSFPAGQDVQMGLRFFLGGGRGTDGEEREREKKDRWHWSTEEINRVASLHSWGLLEGFLLLKTVSSERWQTHRSMKSELQLCSVNLAGCFPSPRLFRMRRLMGKRDFDVLLNSSVEHIRHEAYQLQVQSIWAKFTVGIDDFLHCFRCHFEQVI